MKLILIQADNMTLGESRGQETEVKQCGHIITALSSQSSPADLPCLGRMFILLGAGPNMAQTPYLAERRHQASTWIWAFYLMTRPWAGLTASSHIKQRNPKEYLIRRKKYKIMAVFWLFW